MIKNNFVAKHLREFNKPKVEVDKKKKFKLDRKLIKHQLKLNKGESPCFYFVINFFIYRYIWCWNLILQRPPLV